MTGDFTRNTFRPTLNYSAVRMQQGRVLMDADWNEQADITRWIERRTSTDVIGPCGFPEDAAGFELVPVPGDLGIGPGRAYAGGLLVENPAPAPVQLSRVSGSGANTLYRGTEGPRLRLGQPLPPPDGDLTNAVTVVELEVDGDGQQSVRLSAAIGAGETQLRSAGAAISAQPHLIGEPLPADAGAYLAYLEVWERPIGALEDPTIREVALGGPDTCQRERVIWQVKLLALDPLVAAGEIPDPPSCKSFGAGWRPQGPAEPARLAARAEAASAQVDPCALPAAGGYRSLENHLYRVEIHNGGQLGSVKVTLKWSRDNAMHRTRLLEIADGALVVESAGKDEATAYRTDDWLEVLDEARILAGRPGFFVRLAEVNGDRLGVAEILDPDTLAPLTDNGAPDTDKLPAAGQVRRWEGGAPIEAVTGTWTPLENGVEVRLESGLLATGDYWTIPARTVTADVEWSRDPSSGAPAPLPPEGVARHYCALAIVAHDGTGGWSVTDDCRHLFPPLTGLETFHYLGGDGQETSPDLTQPALLVPLGMPLRVGVARGETPVAGRLVRFTVEESSNAAALSPPTGADVVSASTSVLIVRTDAEGVAAAELALDPRRHRHHVTAELLDAAVPAQADRAHLPIRFAANLSTAAETAYDPAKCAYQLDKNIEPGPAKTVQEALDKLCPAPEFCVLSGNGQLLCQDKEAPEPIRLGLWWGKAPLEGVEVALEVVSGDATVAPAQQKIGPDGTAEVKLIGGADPRKNGGFVRIVAKPIDTPAVPQPAQLLLHARFANADCVYVDADVCPPAQNEIGKISVAAILRHLCDSGGHAPGLHAINIRLNKPSDGRATLAADSIVTPAELAAGVRIELDGKPDPDAFKRGPVGKVVFDQPHPLGTEEHNRLAADFGGEQPFLHQETEILGLFTPAQGGGGEIKWGPSQRAKDWLENKAGGVFNSFKPILRPARLVLYGSRIWAAGDPSLLLDGDLAPDPTKTAGVAYPSGDGVRGGDLVLHFRLGARVTTGPIDFRLGLIAVRDGPVTGGLTPTASAGLAAALEAGIDRPALAAAAVNVPGLSIGTTRANPTVARNAVRSAALGDRAVTVMAHRDHAPILDEVTDQFAALGLKIAKRFTTAANVTKAFKDAISRGGVVDAVLVQTELETALRADADIAPKLGTANKI